MSNTFAPDYFEPKKFKPKKLDPQWRYKVLQYDHFFSVGHDLKGCFFFNSLEEAEKFIKDSDEAKKKWGRPFTDFEYVLEEIKED